MKNHLDQNTATYSPMLYKTFAGALESFFQHECPQLGGQKTRQVLVQSIVEMVNQFYPETHHLRPGQIQWTTVDKNEKASYGKKISQSQLTSVILDLVLPEDVTDRANGKHLRDLKIEAVARLFTQAYEQNGCMTNAELAILLKFSPSTVGKYTKEWELKNERLLPRRGTIHDLGPTLTHKKEIIRKLFLERKSVEQVQRETYHSPEAIHRYIHTFRQILLCRQKGLSNQEISFAVKISLRLVEEYQRLLQEMMLEYRSLDALLNLDIL